MSPKRKKTNETPIINGLCMSEDIVPLYQFTCKIEDISSKFSWEKHKKDFYAAIPENCFCVCDAISKLKIPNQSAIPDEIEFRLVRYQSKNKPISLMHRIRNAFAHGNLSREVLNGKDVYKIIDISTRKSKQMSQNGKNTSKQTITAGGYLMRKDVINMINYLLTI